MERRIEQIRKRLKTEGIDALLVDHPANRLYLTGFTGSAGSVFLTQDEAFLITDFRYIEQATAQAPLYEIVRTPGSIAKTLGELLEGRSISKIAFDQAHTTVKAHRQLQEELGSYAWIGVEGWVEELRAVKDEKEIETMERAVDLADRAFSYIIERLKGRTEIEVAFDLEMYMRREGAQAIAFSTIIASGENGSLPHARPSSRRISEGDMVTLDFGAVVDGYCSDMTRTVVIGKPTAKQEEIYNLVLTAQIAGVDAVRPGVTGKEVDEIVRRIIDDAGYGEAFGHGLGHGVGLEVHESPPSLSKRGETPLVPGMVTSVEPGVYLPNWGGVRIEDLVVVTDTGRRVLTKSPKELISV